VINWETKESSQKSSKETSLAVTKKLLKAGKVHVANVQIVNLKMFWTAFWYNPYHLTTLEIDGVF
jgi:hypothetical protein